MKHPPGCQCDIILTEYSPPLIGLAYRLGWLVLSLCHARQSIHCLTPSWPVQSVQWAHILHWVHAQTELARKQIEANPIATRPALHCERTQINDLNQSKRHNIINIDD